MTSGNSSCEIKLETYIILFLISSLMLNHHHTNDTIYHYLAIINEQPTDIFNCLPTDQCRFSYLTLVNELLFADIFVVYYPSSLSLAKDYVLYLM